ncbi:MAG: tRNA methyl transferase PRC-barrel domain-containing protein, partial [Bacteroidales bacterium]
SYFLCQISQEQLARALFPLGGLYKSQCRELATSLGLATADRRDSQGICFVGKVDLPQFLQQKLAPKKGNIIKIPAEMLREQKPETPPNNLPLLCRAYDFGKIGGKKVGEHQGAHYFTIGQRKGLNVGGTKEPLYVLATDTENNIVYVGEGQNHPGLYRRGLFIDRIDIHWLRPDLKMEPEEERSLYFRIRYRQPLQKGKLLMKEAGAYIIFDQPQRGITPGQFAAWYANDELLGSGVIA